MGRGGNDTKMPDLSSVVSVRGNAPELKVISTRVNSSNEGYDQDDLLYFSGGDLPRAKRHFLHGHAYVSVHHRAETGDYEVNRQIQRPGRGITMEPLSIETLYKGSSLRQAALIADQVWKDMRDKKGLKWDGISNREQPDLDELSERAQELQKERDQAVEPREVLPVGH